MQGNPLIYEYFGLKEKMKSFQIEKKQISLYEKLLPFDITKEEGIKLMFSYHILPDNLKQGRYIDIYDRMSTKESKIYCLEFPVIEVKNAFQLAGEKLEIRDDIIFIKFDDPFWNIPSIMHAGENVDSMLQTTVKTLLSLFGSINHKGAQFIISLTLSFEFNNRLVRISSYGYIEHQIKWLEDSFPFEFSETGITNWVESQRTYVNKFTTSTDTPLLSGLLQTDGVLFIKRVNVEFPYEYEIDDTGIKTVISFPDEGDETLQLFNEKRIKPVICTQVDKAVWSDTKENYFTAIRSKWLNDTNAHVEIQQATPLALYWSKP